MNILALCNYNNNESIAFESIMNHRAMDRVTVFSAGPEPAKRLSEKLVDVMMRLGHDLRDLEPKSWHGFVEMDAPAIDMILTLCPEINEFDLPELPGDPVMVDWSHLFPVEITANGPRTIIDLREIIKLLTVRADTILELPLETMSRNSLAEAFDRIGSLP